jgi:hypothetical protein
VRMQELFMAALEAPPIARSDTDASES